MDYQKISQLHEKGCSAKVWQCCDSFIRMAAAGEEYNIFHFDAAVVAKALFEVAMASAEARALLAAVT